jgi:EF-P beta-lysylation protein EpmB
MIAATSPASQSELSAATAAVAPMTGVTASAPARWQHILAEAITDPAELIAALNLDPTWLPAARRAAALFPLRVPRGYVRRMRVGDPHDPLLRQVLPLGDELIATPGYGLDPVGDLASRAAPGVLHKYHGRALLVTTGACAVHCRYCFRRSFPYGEHAVTRSQWHSALEYLRQDPTIGEVILSGGDPLSLSDARLRECVADIESIPHVRRLRIHTRQPIVLPERIDAAFTEWLASVRLKKVMVVHVNHRNEIDESVTDALARVAKSGVTLLNQSVLLAGVNDSVSALQELSESLFAAGVVPYYLHLLDRVQGAAHFDVPEVRARQLVNKLTAQLPGYLVPKLVREIPGELAKTSVSL